MNLGSDNLKLKFHMTIGIAMFYKKPHATFPVEKPASGLEFKHISISIFEYR
jgi:hypothetical protein